MPSIRDDRERSRARAAGLLGMFVLMGAAPWAGAASAFEDPEADAGALPSVPAGFEVSVFAREPLVRQPCSMAFDARGRLCVGMGPQYRSPKPETPGDSVVLVLDTDGDGVAETTREFATGFNAIQGLAWHGRDLWVANAPDLTVVRDLDGDDRADEYVRVYTDLGNLEHGLHGLNWAPDGRLYMSKGNSKGLTQPGRVAPRAFRDLWGVSAPAGTPDFPRPQVFKPDAYRRAYHDPEDDWGREGGVLRCDDGGANLEIVARGMRNPWDITFDSGFHWLGTDNDQTTGDRVFMPFLGAHFGWNHPWSSHWSDAVHPPTAPVSGPLFEGSGTGVVFGDSPAFPASHRGVFFINDWLLKRTYVWRPRWDGALLRSEATGLEKFIEGGRGLYRPTDLEFGPDGALWILGWGRGYGAVHDAAGGMTSEGRVFRVSAKGHAGRDLAAGRGTGNPTALSVDALVEALDGPLPARRIDAQDELVRRGAEVRGVLRERLDAGGNTEGSETWMVWALGRMAVGDAGDDRWFAERANRVAASMNLRIQCVRILADRVHRRGGSRRCPEVVTGMLSAGEPRLRFEALLAVARVGDRTMLPALWAALVEERDRTCFYAGWQAVRRLAEASEMRAHLVDGRPGVRRAALLALLEDHRLDQAAVRVLAGDGDPAVREVAALWLSKAAAGGETALVRGRPLGAAAAGGTEGRVRVGAVKDLRTPGRVAYALIPAGLRSGARPYVDREYTLKRVPDRWAGLDLLQTANDDDGSTGGDWLRFVARVPVRVHVAMDHRNTSLPRWLTEAFRRESETIDADHWRFDVYSREFPEGTIVLGGNTQHGVAGGKGNYMVFVEALALPSPGSPTEMASALERLKSADAERGEWLFHARGGAGCFQCHRIEDHGNGFAPDLAALGERSNPAHVVQSMLDPNAVITEGFRLHTVVTADAEYAGVLIEESGLSVTVGLATGDRPVIPKSTIQERRTAPTSAMPSYAAALSPGAVADLAAYLLQVSRRDSERSGIEPKAGKSGGGGGFAAVPGADRLVITRDGGPMAEFVFRDPRILRPYLANVHAPDGRLATRAHPPVEGVDATDHDTMHPGVWLGFGEISGTDFWRNRGRIEHERWVDEPVVQGGRLAFAAESRLKDGAGRTLGKMVNRLRFSRWEGASLVEWEAEFLATDSDLLFGDQEEMGFGARVATGITEKSGGEIRSSAGLRTARASWGQSADWCDYSGTPAGGPLGIQLMADPGNFRGCWWHNRDYGVFVANPFGREAMKQGERSVVTVRRGERLRLRFGAVIHAGPGHDPVAAFEAFRKVER